MKENPVHKSVTNIVAQATAQQRTASDPDISSWVGASAGSGKTKVLTDRMLRLLLPREDGRQGASPEKILALTFTKAAANEMSLRLSKKLSEWAVMSDQDLARDMKDNLFGREATRAEIIAARKLFTRVIDAPGGLKIMTIHSFCQSILGRFPIEAGIPPQFQPLEELEQADILRQAQSRVLAQGSREISSPLARAVQTISAAVNEDQFSSLLQSLLGERNQINRLLKRNFGINGLYTNLCTLLNIKPGVEEQEALLAFCKDNASESALRSICPALAASKSSTDQSKAQDIQAYWDYDPVQRSSFYANYKSLFLTAENAIRSAEKITTKAVDAVNPGARDILLKEALRLYEFEESRKSILCAGLTRDLFLIGQAIAEEYTHLKSQRGLLDFDDLIICTLALLKGETVNLDGRKMTPWILYKLDEGLDHVLVDEAQDTNPEQWEIIQQISDDFFDGAGAKEDSRSIFVVGDKKQSIFSFQRAAPEKFDDMFKWFERKISKSGAKFVPVNINTSFRSVQTILDSVDSVFAKGQKASILSQDYLDHIAKRQGQGGLVELWPVFRTQNAGKEDGEKEPQGKGWFLPDRIIESQSGSMQMAARIADTIAGWMERKEILESHARPIQPGDIMVLVRARNAFVGQLVRALKTKNIPVSGVDRMILGEQLVVQDLVSAANFALLPDDDLTLAELLKSPFIGYGEEHLFTLCHERSGTLWEQVKAGGDQNVIAWLEKLIAFAGSEHPYEFFSRIVQEPCPADSRSGNHAIRTRLGEDALDPLDEFLNLALSYEARHCAGLQGFVHWHQSGQSEIKRQMEEGGGAVRIMTVHGSKGLQAPIVFLPDTVRTAASVKVDSIFWPHKTGLDVPAYIGSKAALPQKLIPAYQAIEQKLDEEYRRLLYVAMTRAEERLYIGGYSGKRAPSEEGKTSYWYEDIRSALEHHDGIEKMPSGIKDDKGKDLPILKLSTQRTAEADKTQSKREERQDDSPVEMPVWLHQTAPAEPFPPRPLVPSRPSEPEPAAASPRIEKDLYRFKRGNVTHKLLQILPNLPETSWESAAKKFTAREALKLPVDVQENIVQEIMDILHHPEFGPIFGPNSLAEVPVSGLLNNTAMVSGQIDRLLITEDEILIIDYKTNRPPPKMVQDVPQIYVRQMSSYAQTLRLIYPGHAVRCALLWTDGPRLMTLDV